MPSFIIEGGHRLKGEITPQGAKNEALEVICATLLTRETVTISNIPEILDVFNLVELLRNMGVQVGHPEKGTFSFCADHLDDEYMMSAEYQKQSAALRGSVMMLGPLVSRFGHAQLPQPGGDKIGRRRLDTHFIGLQKLGANFTWLKVRQLSITPLANPTSNNFAACWCVWAPRLTASVLTCCISRV